jgi:DNA replication protein DnaC
VPCLQKVGYLSENSDINAHPTGYEFTRCALAEPPALCTLIGAEIAARDASNETNRLRAAAFPVVKTLEGFDVAASSVPQATLDYLASLEWIRAQHNLAIIGPPGTGEVTS